MNIHYRVSLSFMRYSDPVLPGFSANVEAGLTGNLLFPDLIVPVASITTAREAFESAMQAASIGGPLQRSIKNDKRAILLGLLRQNAGYVQGVAGTNLTGLLSSGYSVVSTNRAQSPLPKATIVSLVNTFSNMLILNLQPLLNARSYEVQIKNGGNWIPLGIYTYARGIIIPNLTSTQIYSVQARAVGGSTGYGDWSDPVGRVVT